MRYIKNAALSVAVALLLVACATTTGGPPGPVADGEGPLGHERGHGHARGPASTEINNPDTVNTGKVNTDKANTVTVNTDIDGADQTANTAIELQQQANNGRTEAANKTSEPYLPKPYDKKTFIQNRLNFGGYEEKTPQNFAKHLRDSLKSHGYEEILISKSDTTWHFTTRIERVHESGLFWKNAETRFDFEKSIGQCHDDGVGFFAVITNLQCALPRIKKGYYKVYIFSLLRAQDDVSFDSQQKLNKQKLDTHFLKGNVMKINDKKKFDDEISGLQFGQNNWEANIALYLFFVEQADKGKKALHFENNGPARDVCKHLEYTRLSPEVPTLQKNLIEKGC